MALGAQSRTILRAEIGRTLPPLVASLVIGAFLGWMLAAPLTQLLPGLAPLDATVYVLALGAVGAIALLATYLPARRVAKIDPIIALRSE
jgi:ABC-type antimicrobial peptide transport system permease subunit